MKHPLGRLALVTSSLLICSQLWAEPKRPECLAPAKPGGGFDITCKLAQGGLRDAGLLEAPMRVTYMPGGIGAVAYNTVVAQRAGEPGTITAWSSGSLLNLAQGKFGRYDEKAVRWLAAIGTDYGAVTVREDSPLKDFDDLVEALRKDPTGLVIGAGGTIGSQDWMQAAMVARSADVDPKKLRYVAFEGGGEPMTALLGGHVQVITSGIGEATAQLAAGKVRSWRCWRTNACPVRWAIPPPPRSRASTSAGRSPAASTSARRSATRTTPGGSNSSTRCWPARSSPRCASSATCCRCRSPAKSCRPTCTSKSSNTRRWPRSSG